MADIEVMFLFRLNWQALLCVCNDHVDNSLYAHTCINLYMSTQVFEGSDRKKGDIQAQELPALALNHSVIAIQLCDLGQSL